jgi:hypothetical protein
MPLYAEDRRFHSRRAEQERQLAICSKSENVRAIHITLSKLHEMMHYDLNPC